MESFTLAAVSLIIAITLIISKTKDALHRSFAGLCSALFLYKAAGFFHSLFANNAWEIIETIGFIAIPPLSVSFSLFLLHQPPLLVRRDIASTAVISLLFAIIFFTPLYQWPYLHELLIFYMAAALSVCYLSLILYARTKAIGVEKKRMIYLSVACTATAFFSLFDFLHHAGYGFPPLSNIFIAALIYFILMIITRPHLGELQEIMAKALFISIMSLFATAIIYAIIGLFGKWTYPPLTHVLVATFIIVISLEPLREILKKLFTTLYPDSKDLFTSLYAFDEKLEREKAILLEEMAPVFAHEIRNPLGSIKGAAQYLRSEMYTDENRKLIDVIIEEVNRLNRVVSQFLNYAKPYNLNIRTEDVNAIVEKALTVIKASDIADSITIEKDLRSDLPPAYVDTEQLIQVILNIAFNAIDAMPAGGTLTFRTSRIKSDTGAAIGIAIRDTGGGIKKEEMKNIFKPFFTTKDRGVGLGLSISQKIIKHHGGHIRVKSLPGKGSIFYVRLDAAG